MTPDASLPRRFARLTALNIAANVSTPLAGLVDTAMLGHLPDLSFLTGVALASVLFDYILWSFGFLRMGTTGVTAQALGRGEDDEVYRTLYRALAFAVMAGGALLVLQWPLREAGFALLAGGPAVEDAGRAYFSARIWGAPAALANFAFLGWFLGREESGRVLALTLVAGLSNIAFNYIFIVRLGMAAAGAGLGTALSQWLMLTVALGLFLSRPRPAVGGWRRLLDRVRLRELAALNRDILVRTVCLLSVFALFVNWSAVLGTTILAVNTVLQRLLYFAAFWIDGVAFATESLAGVSLGRARVEGPEHGAASLRRLLKLALGTGFAFAVVFLLVILGRPGSVFGLVTSHDEVVAGAVRYAPWLVPVLGVGAAAYVLDGLFLGLTSGRRLRNAMLMSAGLGFLPAALFALERGDNDLLWLALALFMAARAATLGWAARPWLRVNPVE